jgi:hypothetical protein
MPILTEELKEANDPKNIAGYGKTTWGMTPEEVLNAEKPRAERIEEPGGFSDGIDKVTIKEVLIMGKKFSATFVFFMDKLHRVRLQSEDNKANDEISIQLFSSVEQLLTEKYGAPTYKGSPDVSWRFPKTHIELSHTYFPGAYSMVTVQYRSSESRESSMSNL